MKQIAREKNAKGIFFKLVRFYASLQKMYKYICFWKRGLKWIIWKKKSIGKNAQVFNGNHCKNFKKYFRFPRSFLIYLFTNKWKNSLAEISCREVFSVLPHKDMQSGYGYGLCVCVKKEMVKKFLSLKNIFVD